MRTAIIAVTLVVCAGRAGASEDARDKPDGTIVQIEGDRAYVDVGDARGLRQGMSVHVLRTVVVKHPVSSDTLTDHFPLGMMTIEQVGSVLSYGRLEKRIASAVKVGDVVRIEAPRPPPEPVRAATAASPAAPTPQTAAALELTQVWQSTIGRTPGQRVAILSAYLRAHPGSPYAAALDREIATFQAFETALREAEHRAAEAESEANSEPDEPEVPAPAIQGALPERILVGDPLDVAIIVTNAASVRSAAVFVRPNGTRDYHRVVLGPEPDGYFRGRVPEELVRPPSIDLFVEVIDVRGAAFSAASAERPSKVEVMPLPGSPSIDSAGHSAVNGFFEFVDWNRFRGNDYHLVAESDFMYRLGGYLYSVRTGFGVLYGRGGTVAQLDAQTCDPKANPPDPACGHEVGFNYGYLEGEFRFHRMFAVATRLLGGHTVSGNGVGAELKMRIGPEQGTSLVVGGSVLKDVGMLGQLSLQWDVVKNFPMSATVLVTNQPAQQDIGVRFIYQVSYRARSWLQPTLRIGYGARDIVHGGLSVGLGLVMGW